MVVTEAGMLTLFKLGMKAKSRVPMMVIPSSITMLVHSFLNSANGRTSVLRLTVFLAYSVNAPVPLMVSVFVELS